MLPHGGYDSLNYCGLERRAQLEDAVNAELAELVKTLERTSRAIAAQMASSPDKRALANYYLRFANAEGVVWCTDDLSRIFTPTIYTVTSTLALEQAARNLGTQQLVHAQFLLEKYPNRLSTHMGPGLYMVVKFAQCCGIPLSAKDQFVWLGTYADPQHYLMTDTRAKMGERLDEEIAQLFFNATIEQVRSGQVYLHPSLHRLIQLNYECRNPSTDETKAYLDHFFTVLQTHLGIQWGWHSDFKQALTTPGTFKHDANMVAVLLTSGLRRLSTVSRDRSRAVVLEVDTAKLSQMLGATCLAVSHRNPSTIASAPYIPPDAVTRVIGEDKAIIPEMFQQRFTALQEVEPDIWLRSVYGTPITPAEVDPRSLDPNSAFCALRYVSGDPVMTWAELLKNGVIAPLNWRPYGRLGDWVTINRQAEYYPSKILQAYLASQLNGLDTNSVFSVAGYIFDAARLPSVQDYL
jgi:hypothetical protein